MQFHITTAMKKRVKTGQLHLKHLYQSKLINFKSYSDLMQCSIWFAPLIFIRRSHQSEMSICLSHYTTPNKDSKENIPKVVNHLKTKGRKEEGVVQVQQIISYLLALQWLLFFNLSNINTGRVKKDIFCLQDRHFVREIGLLKTWKKH